MADRWRETLRSLRDRFTGKARSELAAENLQQTPPPGRPKPLSKHRAVTAASDDSAAPSREATVALNLGIDFGTSFTKVCLRDVGMEESFIIPFQKPGPLIPTVVAIEGNGRLHMGGSVPRGALITQVPHLKMRLAGMPLGPVLQAVDGIDLNSPVASRALSSWFLAAVVERSQEWIGRNESSRLKNRTPVWSANVGVPVEYCDSDAIKIFDEVLGVAWLWLKSGSLPQTLSEALAAYEEARSQIGEQSIDFHAVPEIAAAVYSFVISRESVPGIYVYFDIGGGTVDGVAFNLVNMFGARRINFYSGKVEPLGTSALASALGASEADDGGADLVERLVQSGSAAAIDAFAQRVRQLVGHVIVTAKTKDGRDWRRDTLHSDSFERKFIGSLNPSRMAPLVVFLGGGGAPSAWYRTAIGSTYQKFRHDNAGIPPYHLLEVPRPGDLSMNGMPDAEFRRFAIAYGLSIPFGEGPDVGLPSQFAAPDEPKRRTPSGQVDYLDSKDVYD